MKRSQLAVQLYSFRNYIKTVAGMRDTLRRLRRIGYESVQLSSAIAPMTEPELLAMLREEGFTAPTSHEGSTKLVTEHAAIIARLQALDCRHVAYAFPHWRPTGEGEVIAYAADLNRAAEIYAAAGITLAYHNHAFEFERFGGRTMLEIIYEHAPLLEGEPDLFWIQMGGGDPVAWLEKLAGREKVIHIKDFGVNAEGKALMRPVGSGNLDWRRIFGAAEAGGVECFVVEHDADTDDPFGSFAASFEFLTANFTED